VILLQKGLRSTAGKEGAHMRSVRVAGLAVLVLLTMTA
jgi:hypothetical protein